MAYNNFQTGAMHFPRCWWFTECHTQIPWPGVDDLFEVAVRLLQ